MQQFLLSISLLFSLPGCMSYQIMKVNGKELSQNGKQEFILENDSLRLKYNFHGHNAPVRIEVLNKLNKPIYIDWKRSALIVNDNAISYLPPAAPITGSVYVRSSTWFDNVSRSVSTSSTGSIDGSLGLPGEMEFIPPGSQIIKTLMGVTNSFHDNTRKGVSSREKVYVRFNYTRNVSKITFDEKDSPLRFTSYPTVYADGSLDKPVVLQHHFYISEIIKSNMGPGSFIYDEQGDQFYVSQSSPYTKKLGYGVVSGTAILNIPVEPVPGPGIK